MSKFLITACLCLLSLVSISQTNYYDDNWKDVDKLLQKQKSQDAEKLIEKILAFAKKSDNKEQIIKSVAKLRMAQASRDEKNQVNNIIAFEKVLPGLKFPEKNVVHSMIAALYQSYYQSNRWKIMKRTNVANASDLKYPKDVETWTPQIYFDKIQEHYEASLQNAQNLTAHKIETYKELISKGENTDKLHPTLFDILAHRAIDFYMRYETDIAKPAYFFQLNDRNTFADIGRFANTNFKNKDDYSSKFLALKYLQLASAIHKNDKEPSALIDLEAKRLKFSNEQYTGKDKEKLYINALRKLVTKYPNNNLTAKPLLALIELSIAKDRIKAMALCNELIEKYPKSIEYTNAINIKQSIKKKSLNLITENADVPNKNILGKVDYKNINQIHFKVIDIGYEDYRSRILDYRTNKKIPTKGNIIHKWSLDVSQKKAAEIYDAHITEFKINPLPAGHYAIVASGDPSFNSRRAPVSFTLFHSTEISYVQSTQDKKSIVYVLNRGTGSQMENAQVTRYKNKYDYKKRRNILTKVDTRSTDKNGQIIYENESNRNKSYQIEIMHQNDTYWAQNGLQLQRSYKTKDHDNIYLFTDRAIYRPGQNIFFKGIFIHSNGDGKEHKVKPNQKVTVVFKDANYKEVKKVTLTTNDFGSFNGTFKAPQGLLNGNFTIYTNKGSKTVKVEEYKRPKFEVVMDSLDENVKLGDEVTVSGKAKAYAGNAIDGAKVKYTVRRKVRYPYRWCWWYYGSGSQSQEIVLATGEATTDKNGKFNITFTALGDEDVNPRTKPFYDFEVNADVTDINGETRTGNKNYTVTKQSLIVNIKTPEQSDFNEFNSIAVDTRNVSGKFTPKTIEIALYQLQEPERFLKKRFWTAPEKNGISQVDFKKYFPDYEFDKESNPLLWKNKKTIWRKVQKTQEGQSISLPKISPKGGYYLIVATTKDKDGNEIEDKKVIRLINTERTKAQKNEALFAYLNRSTSQPEDKTTLSISSAFKNAVVHKSIERQGQTSNAWSNSKELFKITEKDRGGFYATYFTVKNNRYYAESKTIQVPWDNKELDISFETFRNKILPGSQQEWKVKISGKRKEKFSAELLTTMYDASLDAFAKNNWSKLNLYGNTRRLSNFRSTAFTNAPQKSIYNKKTKSLNQAYRQYPQLNMFGLNYYGGNTFFSETYTISSDISYNSIPAPPPSPKKRMRAMANKVVGGAQKIVEKVGGKKGVEPLWWVNPNEFMYNGLAGKGKTMDESKIKVRTDMSETAYFMPNLKTDIDGNIIFSFKAPEALTRWNIKALAHTQDLKTGYAEKTLQTQKELMITPNHPRFMRENDRMVYSAKISNLSDKIMNGSAKLILLNAKTEEPVNKLFNNLQQSKSFTAAIGQSDEVNWNIIIPESYTEPILVKIIAQAGSFSDGEQVSMPLLLNSMLVTETLPLPVRANTTRTFSFDKLKNSGNSNTLKHHKLTIEYTSNPAWYAVQALPYLTDYPYECSEQTFNRYYANALASHIVNSSPKIKEIFSKWKDKDTSALLSNLEKNKELKSALLQETPWVLDAENETEQKKKIANLFNMARMSTELATTITKLEKLQTPNGGFAWFKGMRDNRYITQYIVTGIARLQKLGVADAKSNAKIQKILDKAIPYLDARIREDYAEIVKKLRLKQNNLGYNEIQYLYMRSFFPEKKMSATTKIASNYFLKKGKTHWTSYNKYMQGMLAIVMNRNSEEPTAQDIMEALRQNAIHKDEMGMYWKEFNKGSYWWYQAPIEAHSLLIEAFNEIPNKAPVKDLKLNEVDELRIWLLKQKQTQQWRTTKATADACYALLLGGMDWLSAEPEVEINLGKKQVNLKDYKQQAGTGYTKIAIDKKEIKPAMGDIKVKVTSDKAVGTTWGAVYWQYFEKLDKITEAETPLSLKKQVFKVVNGARGEELVLISDNVQLKVGDKVKVRIELRVDRRMEFVHMKDLRGACFEPTNVMSNYKYQNGLGYYESTKDASTQFFFDNLRPGTYVFEYPMFATLKGNYSNGITTIQCMYAPEFSSHSEGIRVEVK